MHDKCMIAEIGNTILTAAASVVVLFLLTKLLGNKQISQLSMFDYIIGISIGSIAAEMATDLEAPHVSAVAMAVYAILSYCNSLASRKSLSYRKFSAGRTILLMDGGVIYRGNLNRAKFDLSEFLTLCRISGYFDVSEIQTAILEQNGTVSFLPKETQRPVQPADLGVYPKQRRILTNVILDGHVQYRNLRSTGHDVAWLEKELGQLGYEDAKAVFLATVDQDGKLTAYKMAKENRVWDPFE